MLSYNLGSLEVSCDMIQGDRVQIIDGPFSGNSGVLLNKNGKYKLGVQIDGFPYNICFDIDIKNVRKLL
jgi:transcription antitermination factor NusG